MFDDIYPIKKSLSEKNQEEIETEYKEGKMKPAKGGIVSSDFHERMKEYRKKWTTSILS
jgi:hypothetical protein